MKRNAPAMTQPIYDFQATDLFKIMVKDGLSKKRAKGIIQKYIDKHGLLEWKT